VLYQRASGEEEVFIYGGLEESECFDVLQLNFYKGKENTVSIKQVKV